MSALRPYHQWSHTHVQRGTSSSGLTPLYTSGAVIALANAVRVNQPDDLVERVFLDVQVGCLFKPTSADVTAVNNLWPDITFLVAASVEEAGSGSIPDPTQISDPQPRIVLTGMLTMVASGTGIVPDPGFLAEQWAVWRGTFESQGVRASPAFGTGPAVEAAMYVNDHSSMSAGPSIAPVSDWQISTYLRALFASKVPY